MSKPPMRVQLHCRVCGAPWTGAEHEVAFRLLTGAPDHGTRAIKGSTIPVIRTSPQELHDAIKARTLDPEKAERQNRWRIEAIDRMAKALAERKLTFQVSLDPYDPRIEIKSPHGPVIHLRASPDGSTYDAQIGFVNGMMSGPTLDFLCDFRGWS